MLTLIELYVLTVPFLVCLLVVLAICEFNDNDVGAVTLAIFSGIVAYFMYKPSLGSIAVYSIGYLCYGIIWSIWRYKQYIAEQIQITNGYNLKATGYGVDMNIMRLKEENTPKEQVSRIVSWILTWPVSAVVHISRDMVALCKNFVLTAMITVYENIYKNEMNKIVTKEIKDETN
jgi:hypothetical protein